MLMKVKNLLLILILPFLLAANSFAELSQYDANAPLGFAKSVTGGKGGSCVTVTSSSELKSALEKSGKYEIYVKGAIEFTSLMKLKDVKDKTLYGLPGSYLYSNKQDASTSGILYFSGASNFIMRNMTFKGPGAYDCDGSDHLCLDKCTNVWIDHCDFQDGVDGNFDCKNASDNICVSWCRFHYLKPPKAGGSGGSNDHRYTDLWGSSDSATGDRGKLKTTFVCCWWDNGCVERMPRVRFGQVHLVNCLWSSSSASYCVGLGIEAMCYVEKCAFIGVQDPLKDYDKSKKSAGKLVDCYMSNVKVQNGSKTDIRNCTFNPSTYYTNNIAKMSAQQVQGVVSDSKTGAGATLEVTACGGVDGTVSEGGNTGGSSETEATAVLTKNGTPSSTQTVEVGTPIGEFGYTWTGATSAEVSGLPAGVTAKIDNNAKSIVISGTPTAVGVFKYTVKTVGATNNDQKSATITVTEKNGGNTGGTTEQNPSYTEAPTITKHGSGSATQTINLGEPIAAFNYTYTNCSDVKVEGMPEGIVVTKSSGKVEFSGTPASAGNYEFTVTSVGGISEVSKSGVITVVSVVSSLEDSQVEEVGVVPTTVDDYFEVRGIENAKVSVLNAIGLSVAEADGSRVDCSSLPAGLYIVRVTENGKNFFFKIVKK